MFEKIERAFFHRRDNGGEVVVGQHDVGRLLGDVGPGDAHGNADVGRLQGRRVVDAVAGHRHDGALRAEAPARSAACVRG